MTVNLLLSGTVIYSPIKHLGALKNSFENVRAVHIKLEFGIPFFFKTKGKSKYLNKNLSVQGDVCFLVMQKLSLVRCIRSRSYKLKVGPSKLVY